MKGSWLATGVLALTLVAFSAPVRGADRDDRRDQNVQTLNFDNLPGPVKATIGREKGSAQVDDVTRVSRGGRTYYKARIDAGTTERLLVVNEDGKLVRSWDVSSEGKKKIEFNDLPGAVKSKLGSDIGERHIRQIYSITRDGATYYWVRTDNQGTLVVDERGKVSDDLEEAQKKMDRDDREKRVEAGWLPWSAILLADARDDRGDKSRSREIQLNDCPRDVQQAIERERGNARVQEITEVNRDGKRYYKARLDRNGQDRLIVVNESGKVTGSWDLSDQGGNKREINFDKLPRDVQQSLDREFGERRIRQIYQIERGGRNYYWVRTDNQGTVVVDERGRISDDLGEATDRGAERRDNRDGGNVQRLSERGDSFNPGDYRSLRPNDLPDPVRRTLDREAGRNAQIEDIARVDRDNRTYYKARVEDRNGNDRVLIISPEGEVVRNWSPGLGQGKTLSFDELPGQVKSALGKQFGGNKVERVTQFTRNGQTYYRARVEGQGSVLVDQQGNFVDEGFGGFGQRTSFEQLPGPVKQAVGSRIGGNNVRSVYQETRGGRTVYNVEANNGQSITVDADGNILNR